jgi:transcriptional regulator with XRE-family HTH domain
MSYGHADKLAAIAAGAPAAHDKQSTPPAPPWARFYDRADVRAILAERDIGGLFRVLKDDAGLTQRTIADLTEQSQSEVSEILAGRRVLAYDVLVRIAEGLGVPRELMGLSYGECSAYGGGATAAEPPEDEDVLRRDLLAAGSVALVGVPVLGKLLNGSPRPGEMWLPSQVGLADVAEIKNTTEQLRAAARLQGGQARAVSAAAIEYGRLTQVPAAEPVAARLGSALAELNTLAGWCCYDSGLQRRARWHYRQAMDLAARVDDDFRVIGAAQHAAMMDREHGRPNDALKLYQLAQFKLMDASKDDPRVSALDAWLSAQSGSALVLLDRPEDARSNLSQAQEGREHLPDAFERADMDHLHALIHLHLGNLDVAEQFATSSVRGWGEGNRRDGVLGEITSATIHVQAGEPNGLRLAHGAVTAVSKLRSQRARDRLAPLITTLESRPGSDHRELARMARQVAVTRA